MASVGSTAKTNATRPGASHEESPRAQVDDERLAIEREAHRAELRRLRTLNLRLTQELRDSRARIMSAAVQERQRIERDLHDGAQQLLVAAQVRIGLARALIAGDPSRGHDLLDLADADLQHALDELRLLAHGVYPAILSDRGIGPALREAARRCPLDVTIESDGTERYPPEIESAVYFCCLESLQNAVKHATGATGASIRLTAGADLAFDVRDDGAGFVPRAAKMGSGLTNMRDRLAAVDGYLELRSALGRGTSVIGTIPLQADA